MKRKICAVLFVSVLAATLMIGCGNTATSESSESSEGGSTEGDELQVAFLTSNLANENWQTLTDATIRQGGELGWEVSVTDCAGNPSTQVTQIESEIEAGYDMIILGPADSNALIDVCGKAVDAGIPVISTDGYFENVSVVVGANEYDDGYELGVYAGEWVNENWPDKESLNVNVLSYDWLDVCIERKNGLIDGFEETANAAVTIVADNSVQTAAEANETSESVLQADTIDVCLSVAGDFLYGFCQAAQNHGLTQDDVVGFSMDITEQSALLLQEGGYVKGLMSWGSPDQKAATIIEGCQKALDLTELGGSDYEKVFYGLWYVDESNIDDIMTEYGWGE